MQQFRSLQDADLNATWLTIGAFDGVHLGHQKIIRELVAGAHLIGAPAALLSFDPHPVEVLRGPQTAFYLSTQEEKAELLAELGLDALVVETFDEHLATTSAREFMERIKQQLDIRQLWIGHDFAMGHNREGDFDTLSAYGEELGFSVHPVSALELDGEVVSSSRIRRALGRGAVDEAEKLLGRPYSLMGTVSEGAGRGSSIGIPTANLEIWPKRVVPASGVYVCRAHVGGQDWPAVSNIGVRPTFEDKLLAPVVESHLLDYHNDEVDGEKLRLSFVARLRDEQRFSSVDELLEQIQRDIEQARQILKG